MRLPGGRRLKVAKLPPGLFVCSKITFWLPNGLLGLIWLTVFAAQIFREFWGVSQGVLGALFSKPS